MKKFIAIGITSLGGLGLIGMGASAASAAPVTARSQVCISATAQLAAQAPALAAAGAVATNAHNALSLASSTVGTTEEAYVTSAMQVVTDVDGSALPQTIAADTTTFNNAVTAFVNAVVGQSAASVTDFNASKSLTQLSLQADVLNSLEGQSC